MVVFAIPLRARATSKDWNKCEERLRVEKANLEKKQLDFSLE